MRVGDLVKCNPETRIGIIVDWHIIYDRFGEAVDRHAVVMWETDEWVEHEYPDMLEVVNGNW